MYRYFKPQVFLRFVLNVCFASKVLINGVSPVGVAVVLTGRGVIGVFKGLLEDLTELDDDDDDVFLHPATKEMVKKQHINFSTRSISKPKDGYKVD